MNESAPGTRAATPWRRMVGALVVSVVDAALLALALGGLKPLAHDPRALVLIAIWTASSLVLAVIRAPRVREVSEREAEARVVLLALVLIPLITPAISAWTERLGLGVLRGGAALHWTGVTLAALGLALRIAAIAQLGRRFSPRLAIQTEHALETGGLYARVRHPGYLGALVTNLGSALAFSSLPGLAMLVLLAFAVRVRVTGEERLLASRFGSEYQSYRSRTGALFPRWG